MGPVHLRIAEHVALNRFEQLTRFLHVSDPTDSSSELVFDKLEPFNEHSRSTIRRYWRIGTHLSVDESLERFMGRSAHIVNGPSKSELEGYKI